MSFVNSPVFRSFTKKALKEARSSGQSLESPKPMYCSSVIVPKTFIMPGYFSRAIKVSGTSKMQSAACL